MDPNYATGFNWAEAVESEEELPRVEEAPLLLEKENKDSNNTEKPSTSLEPSKANSFNEPSTSKNYPQKEAAVSLKTAFQVDKNAKPDPPPRFTKVRITNISNVKLLQLRQKFIIYGPMSVGSLFNRPEQGTIATLVYQKREDALKCVKEMNGTIWNGQKMKVELVKEENIWDRLELIEKKP